jgi:vitamin B12 transporter
MFKAASRPAGRAVSLVVATLVVAVAGANALSPALADELPEIVVTADRVEEPIGQTGASVTVIHAAEIEKLGTKGLADVLRGVAGLDVADAGGVGSVTQVRLRAANPGQTLVLIDGIRIGNTTATDGSVDFGNLAVANIDRIEILRGPQSALYGSDAMGGVINIITRKGSKTPRRTVTVEAGSYGTLSTRATMSGGDDTWTYSLGVNALHSDGFPQYGYRIDRPIIVGTPVVDGGLGTFPLPQLPVDDPTDKGGLSGRFTYRASDNVTIDFGFSGFGNALRFDDPGAVVPGDVFSPYNHSTVLMGDAFVRANIDSFGGVLKSQLTTYGNITKNDVWETESCYDGNLAYPFPALFNCRNSYLGTRYGAEYQGDLNIGSFGSLVFGAKSETETANETEDPDPNDGSYVPVSARQVTNSLYAEHRINLFQRLDVTLGGRIDAVESGRTFETWRATAAYHIDETGTKLRASAGTGARNASLYQRFSSYGTPDLAPEQSLGFDAGIDQKLLGDRLTASATVFSTKFSNLIAYGDVSSCSTAQMLGYLGCYYNVGRAQMQGVEVSAEAVLAPGVLRARASYTYTDARDLGAPGGGDLDAGMQLYRIPRNKGAFSLIYDGVPNLEIEPRLTLEGERLDEYFSTAESSSQNVKLSSYAKLDVLANYKVNDNLTMFGRIENLTDTRYEEVYNYGTAGRSYYAGLSYSW